MNLRRPWNLIRCPGWSFRLDGHDPSPAVARPGDRLTVRGSVVNNGFRVGSAYIIVLLADPYNHRRLTFSTHRDLAPTERQALRLVDVSPGERRAYSIQAILPHDIDPGVHDVQVQLWNPVKLYHNSRPLLGFFHHHMFDWSPWRGCVEVVKLTPPPHAQSGQPGEANEQRSKAFISYSWDSAEHQRWVLDLAGELLRHGVTPIVDKYSLAPGEEITEFIERGIRESDILILVCSDRYTEKADGRIGGVGMETVVSTATFLAARRSKKFIPVVRGNTRAEPGRLPTYLGSTLYVDMDTPDWRAEPLQALLRGIQRKA
jgi:hypothetical protein